LGFGLLRTTKGTFWEFRLSDCTYAQQYHMHTLVFNKGRMQGDHHTYAYKQYKDELWGLSRGMLLSGKPLDNTWTYATTFGPLGKQY
jgi:hypothetical protein